MQQPPPEGWDGDSWVDQEYQRAIEFCRGRDELLIKGPPAAHHLLDYYYRDTDGWYAKGESPAVTRALFVVAYHAYIQTLTDDGGS